MNYTQNSRLRLPENDDPFNIEDLNYNATQIDAVLAADAQSIAANAAEAGAAAAAAEQNAESIGRINTALASKQAALGYTPVQQGGGTGQKNTKLYLGWTGANLKAQASSTDLGYIVTTGSATTVKLPIEKGGTGEASAGAALNALTEITTVSVSRFCTNMVGGSSVLSGYVRKIGDRISSRIRITNVTSSASGAMQVVQIVSAYRPHSTYGGASVGPVSGLVRANGKFYSVTGYVNAADSSNGIVTCVFPASSTAYDFVDLFLDYYCGA
ncbi:MAG: hypothetical protein IJK23_04340 [Clostridia bacterium]|nr:hypothetical protein [Clostridia bacterium]